MPELNILDPDVSDQSSSLDLGAAEAQVELEEAVSDIESLMAELPDDLRDTLERMALNDVGLVDPGELEALERLQLADRKISQTIYDKLREKDLWAYTRIGIETGTPTVYLRYEHLGLSQATLEKLTELRNNRPQVEGHENKGRKKRKMLKPPQVVLFPTLATAGDVLARWRRENIQDKMFWDGSVWLCEDEKLVEVEVAISEWGKEIQKWRNIVFERYLPERKLFRAYVARWLKSASDDLVQLGEEPLEISALIPVYDSLFPSLQLLYGKLRPIIIGPQPVPSLMKQAEENAKLAEALRREAQAQADTAEARNARREADIRLQAIERERQVREQSMVAAAQSIEDSYIACYQRLLDQAERFGKGRKPTPGKKEALAAALAALEQELQKPGAIEAFSELQQESEVLRKLCEQGKKARAEIEEKVKMLRDQISKHLEFTPQTGQVGSRTVPTRMRRKSVESTAS